MNRYALTHLDDHVLLRDLVVHVTRNCTATADLLAHLAEVDARKLYLPAAHPSMHSTCVHVLRLSEDAASKRIHVARKAREFPAIFSAVADGSLHLSGAVLLAPHLTPDNADELLAAAARKTKSEVEVMLAHRLPKPDVPTRITPAASASPLISESSALALTAQHAPGHVEVRPRAGRQRSSANPRYVPTHVKRAAAERRKPVAQPEPEPKPEPEPEPEPGCAASVQHELDRDLLHCLKGLGWRADTARLAMEHSGGNPEASIEERLHAALKFLGARGRSYGLRRAAMNRSVAAGSAPSGLAAP